MSSSVYKPEIEEEQIRTLVARGADGLLLIGHDRDPKIYDYLSQRKIPALIAWSFLPESKLPSVGFDNHFAMFELARHVIELGHKQIGVISGIVKGNDRARLRVEGIQEAVNRFGADPITVIETPYEIENGADAFRQLMQSETPPTVNPLWQRRSGRRGIAASPADGAECFPVMCPSPDSTIWKLARIVYSSPDDGPCSAPGNGAQGSPAIDRDGRRKDSGQERAIGHPHYQSPVLSSTNIWLSRFALHRAKIVF